jgi:hypothetical protein
MQTSSANFNPVHLSKNHKWRLFSEPMNKQPIQDIIAGAMKKESIQTVEALTSDVKSDVVSFYNNNRVDGNTISNEKLLIEIVTVLDRELQKLEATPLLGIDLLSRSNFLNTDAKGKHISAEQKNSLKVAIATTIRSLAEPKDDDQIKENLSDNNLNVKLSILQRASKYKLHSEDDGLGFHELYYSNTKSLEGLSENPQHRANYIDLVDVRFDEIYTSSADTITPLEVPRSRLRTVRQPVPNIIQEPINELQIVAITNNVENILAVPLELTVIDSIVPSTTDKRIEIMNQTTLGLAMKENYSPKILRNQLVTMLELQKLHREEGSQNISAHPQIEELSPEDESGFQDCLDIDSMPSSDVNNEEADYFDCLDIEDIPIVMETTNGDVEKEWTDWALNSIQIAGRIAVETGLTQAFLSIF